VLGRVGELLELDRRLALVRHRVPHPEDGGDGVEQSAALEVSGELTSRRAIAATCSACLAFLRSTSCASSSSSSLPWCAFEDQGAGGLDLPHRQLPPVPGIPVFAGQRQREPGHPPFEPHLHRSGPSAAVLRAPCSSSSMAAPWTGARFV
jgi:hypothetical protein